MKKIDLVTGHASDCAALYDRKTKTLISGDCLQLFGVFGSGAWGANISFFNSSCYTLP